MSSTTDTRTVSIQLNQLTEHLGCALCSGLLREAQTIPECLHSFCKSCIYRHFLVQGSRKCPKCFIALKPRPITTLISDQRLQDVVDRIFPEFRENEERLEAEFYETHMFKKKDNSQQVSKPTTTSRSTSRKRTASMLPSIEPRRITLFAIEVHPQLEFTRALSPLRLPYLTVDGRFKVFDLLKYVRRQLELNESSELEVLCMGATVGPELSIQFIHRTIWQVQHEDHERLVLHYRLLIP
ncbi:hypothetical protein Poli38472_007977 [Pythium oligandrum]|uniref:RING-type domain-containing protein n=1 Tax=Pythium oligandrum TaxID=41045 RepID=A0A8K1CL95_PYTOL|nr:hypothetical protein Poli38472_007977 [Pythium oligandrum]|eukprot:TMW65335.1 hypothetical protein Poli38472_007977 [Pythium oligandrum]